MPVTRTRKTFFSSPVHRIERLKGEGENRSLHNTREKVINSPISLINDNAFWLFYLLHCSPLLPWLMVSKCKYESDYSKIVIIIAFVILY